MPFGCALGSIVRECSLSVHEYHWSIVGQPGGTPRSGRGGRDEGVGTRGSLGSKSCHSDQHFHTKCKKTVPKRPRPPAKAKYATQGVRRTFYRLLFLDGDRIFRSCSRFGSLASSFKPPAVCLGGRCKSSLPVRA